jgi:hypothetical protein
MQDNGGNPGTAANTIPTQTFAEPEVLSRPTLDMGGVDQAEMLLRKVGAEQELSGAANYSVREHDSRLFGYSIGRVFGIAAILLAIIIGVTSAGVLRGTKGSGSNGDGRQLLASAGFSAKDLKSPDNSVLHINSNSEVSGGKSFTTTGNVLLQSTVNSADAFKIQNSDGANILVADTKNNQINIGNKPPGNVSLNVSGDISTNGALVSTTKAYSLSDQGLSIGGVVVCTARGCVSSSSPLPTPSSPTIDVANLAFLNKGQIFSGNNAFSGNSSFNGSASFATNTTFSAQVQAAGDIDSSSGFSVGGTAGTNLTCGPNELLQQGIIQGGIITGGSCVAVAGGTVPTLQQVYDSSVPAALTLSSASGGVQIQDSLSPLGTSLFDVTNNAGTTTYFAVNNLGISVTGNINATGQYQINGAQISSSNLSDGANLAKLNGLQTFTNANTFSSAGNSFTGSGAGLTSLGAGNISSGTLNDARLSSNVALKNGNNAFSGNDSFTLSTTALSVQDAGSPLAGNLFQVTNNAGVTKYFEVSATGAKINGNDVCTTAGNCAGVGGGVTTSGGTTNKLAKFTAGQAIGDSIITDNGTNISVAGNINTTGQYQVGGVQISSSNLSDGANLAKLNAGQSFTGANTFSNASNSFTGSGSGLTSLNASNISSGTLSDARLSSNVALLNANQTFTGNDIFSLSTAGLAVQDAASPLGADLFKVTDNAGTTKYFSVSSAGAKVNGNDVCTTAGNCAGVGGGVTTAGGTTNKLAKFTAGQAIGDSIITDNGSTVTIGGTLSVNTITPTAALTLGAAGQGLTLQGNGTTKLSATSAGITNSIVFAAPTVSNKTITVPDASGTVAVSASGPLALDAAGNLTCPSCLTTNGSGGGSGVSSLNTLSGALTIAGTANQITITPSGSTLTLSTPQDIAGTSSPSFANVNVSGQFKVGGSQISSANLSNDANLAKLNGTQTFTGVNTFKNGADSAAAFQIQNSAGTSNLLIADTTDTRLAVAKATASYTLDVGGDVNTTGVYRINGTAIASGNLSDSANLAKLNANQTFTGNNTFSSASNSFTGDGSGLTSLNASNISSGTLNDARLSANVPLKNAVNTFTNTNVIQATSSAEFQVQSSAAAETLLTVDSSARSVSGGNLIKIGNSTGTDGSTTILVLDSTTTTPTTNLAALNGGLFYDSSVNHLQVIENGVVKTVCNTTDLGCGSASTGSTSQTKVVAMGSPAGCTGSTPVASQDANADYVVNSCTSAQTTINTAVSAISSTGGTVYLKEGTYIIDGSITIPSNVTLSGAGASTIIKLKDGINAAISAVTESALSQTRFAIKNLKFDGNKANNTSGTQRGVDLTSSGSSGLPGPTVSGVEVTNFRNEGFYANAGAINTTLTNNIATTNTGTGFFFSLNASGNNVFTGNTSLSNSADGFMIGGGNDVVQNNVAKGNSTIGFNFNSISCNHCSVLGNTSDGNSTFGIDAGGSEMTISGNIVENNTTRGIYIRKTNVTVNGNLVFNNGTDGIFLGVNATNNVISNNQLENNTGATANNSITVDQQADSNRIIGNEITDTAGSGCAIGFNGASFAANVYLSNNNYSGTGAASICNAPSSTIFANQLNSNGDFVFRSQSGTAFGALTATASVSLQGGASLTALPAVAQPGVVKVGTAGTTTWGYKVTALDGLGETAGSTEKTIANGNAVLDGTNFNTITWAQVGGAINYKIYRTTAGGTPATTGLIGTVAGTITSFNDTGIAATTAAPATNTSGGISVQGNVVLKPTTDSASAFQVQNAAASETLISIDTTARSASGGNLIKIGNSTGTDGSTTILVVDTASAAPTSNLGALNGGLYYNSGTNHLNVIENGAVKELCNKTDQACGAGGGSTTTLQNAYDNSSSPATITTSSASKNIIIKSGATFNSTGVFQVQDSSSNVVLDADTTNRFIGVNNSAPNASLDVVAVAAPFFNGFESGLLAPFASVGASAVTITTNAAGTPHSGADYAFSSVGGGVPNLTITKTFSSGGVITYWMKAQTNDVIGTNRFLLNVDGSTCNSVIATFGGWPGWTQQTCNVIAGTHLLSWTTNNSTMGIAVDDITMTNVSGSTSAATFNAGNVGIGTYFPNATLDVTGTEHFQASTDSTTLFQVQNAAGVNLLNLDSTNSAITVAQGNLLVTGLGTPVAAIITAGANTGGSLLGSAGTTYFYKVTAINSAGNETLASPESSINGASFTKLGAPSAPSGVAVAGAAGLGIGNYRYKLTVITANGETTGGTESAIVTTTSGNQNVTVTLPAVPTGATGFKVYRTVVGGASGSEKLVNAGGCTGTISAATCTDSATDAQLSATTPPVSNTATTNVNNATVTFTTIPGAVSYRVYRGTATGAESAYQTTATSPFTDTGAAGTANTTPVSSGVERVGIGTSAPTANLDVRGTALFKNGVNSTSSFQIQDASGNSALNVDTTNRYIGINQAMPNATLDVQASSNSFFDGFESGSLTPFTTTGTAAVSTANPPNAHTGNDYALVGNFTASNSFISLTKTLNSAGTVTSWVSANRSVAGNNSVIKVDGTTCVSITTSFNAWSAYTQYNCPVSSGTHTITWESGTLAAELAVDDVTITNAGVGNAALFNGGNIGIGTAFPNATLDVTGTVHAQASADSATFFQLQSASAAETLFTVDTTARSASGGNLIKVGSSTGTDTATTILQVDSATVAPTTNLAALNGGLFYNSGSGHINAIENGAVKELCNKTDQACGTGGGSTTTLQNAYDNSSSPATITTSSASKNIIIKAGASNDSTGIFQVQDSSGNSVLNANSVNRFVGVNNSNPNATLDVQASSASFMDGFESGLLAPFTQVNPTVTVSTSNPHSGSYSVVLASNGGTIQITKTFTAGTTITFWGINTGGLTCRFIMDGSQQFAFNGATWAQYSQAVSSGTHTFQWQASSAGCNVDDVVMPNTGAGTAALFNGGNVGIGTSFPNAGLEVANNVLFDNTTNSATAFQVQSAAGAETLLTVDTTARSASGGNLVKIGNSTGTDTATTVLVVDSNAGALTSNLSAFNGGLYYNSSTNHINVIEGGAVKELCNKTDLGCGSTPTTTLQNAYDNSSSPATITTSSAAKTIIVKAGSSSDATNLLNIQDSSGASTLDVDTAHRNVGINNVNPQATLDVLASSSSFFNGFETGSLTPFTTTAGGGTPFTAATSGGGHSGSYYAYGVTTGSAVPTLSLSRTLNVGGNITYWCKGSSGNSTFATLVFTIDGVNQNVNGCITGAWTQFTFAVASGAHTFTWYIGDNNGFGAQLFVDDVTVTNAGAGTAAVFNGGNVGIGTSFPNATLDVTGTAIFKPSTDSATAFQIQNAAGASMFTVDTSGTTITLGSASSTPVLLVLGNKNTAGDPTCVNGAIYYNSSTNQFRGCSNGAWGSIGADNIVTSVPTTNLFDGEKIRLRTNSSPYDYLNMTYDATYSHWVSDPVLAYTLPSDQTTTSSSHVTVGPTVLLKNGNINGLTLQAYGSIGLYSSSNGCQANATIQTLSGANVFQSELYTIASSPIINSTTTVAWVTNTSYDSFGASGTTADLRIGIGASNGCSATTTIAAGSTIWVRWIY